MMVCIYVMWSKRRQLSKVGLSSSPHARASQLRGEKDDATIRLMTCWNIIDCGEFLSAQNLELHIHQSLRSADLEDPGNSFPSEWFTMRWAAAAEFIEQWSQIWAPAGLVLKRMPASHG
jgi:hypothetical protein